MKLSQILSASRRLRSLHFVPGGNQKFLDKALASRADALILDLEDSVVLPEKAAARTKVSEWISTATDFGSKTVCVRINALDTTFWEKDLEETLSAKGPHMYMIPKVSSPEELERVSAKISDLEAKTGKAAGSTTLIPICSEVPSAPLRAHEIAKASRVEAITWGAEDLSAELGASRNKNSKGHYLDVFQLCRSLVLLAAKGANVQAIDGVYTDLKNVGGCRAEATEALETGFDGKLTIHPDQIDAVNTAFTPSAKELEDAKALLEAAKTEPGAFRFKGQMVDVPHVKRAERIVERASGSVGADALEESAPKWPEGPRHGKWLDELTEGLVIQHALTRTVTETDNVLFTTLSLNPAKLHLDYEAAKGTQFKKPLVNSMYTVALLVGMSVLETTHGTTVANLGFQEVSFPRPVFFGDSIRAETVVLKARPSSKDPTRGIVTFEHRAYNQDGHLVCKAVRNALMLKKPSGIE